MKNTENNVAAQAGDEPMREAPSVKPSEWCAETPLNAIIDGDAIAKSKRIMALIDNYTEAMDSPINQHARNARTAIRCALMAEFEAISLRATADVERERLLVEALRNIANYRTDIGPQITAQSMRFYAAQALMDFATTKPGA